MFPVYTWVAEKKVLFKNLVHVFHSDLKLPSKKVLLLALQLILETFELEKQLSSLLQPDTESTTTLGITY